MCVSPYYRNPVGLSPSKSFTSIGISWSNLREVSHSFQGQADVQLTLRANHQTSTLLCATVDSLDDIDQLLLVLQDPVELVVVSSTKVAHHMFIAEEEHKGDWIVEFYEKDISASLEKKMPDGQDNNTITDGHSPYICLKSGT
jgi:hypothetical protein